MKILTKSNKLMALIIIYIIFIIIAIQINTSYFVSGEKSGAALNEEPEVIWSKNIGTEIISYPIIDKDTIYIVASSNPTISTNSEGTLFALDKKTGEIKWQFDLGKKGEGPAVNFVTMAQYQDLLFVGSNYNGLYFIDTLKSEMVWRETYQGVNKPIIVQDHIYLTDTRNFIFCLNLNRGTELWRYPVYHTNCVPAIHDNLVYGADFNHIFALENASGTPVWRYEFEGRQIAAWASPVIYENKLIITTADYKLHVFELPKYKNNQLSGGAELWNLTGEQFYPPFSQPVVHEDKIYISYNNAMHALDIDTGDVEWEHDLECRALAIAGDKIITASDNTIYCLNAQTGSTHWEFGIEDAVDDKHDATSWTDTFAMDDESIYISDQDGTIYRISGSEKPEPSSEINWSLSFCINIFIIIIIVLVIYVIIKLRSGKTS